MNLQWLLTALGIMVGTYIVRAIPFWIPSISGVSPFLQRFLRIVPAAALGALIAPDAYGTVSAGLTTIVIAGSIALTLRGIQLTVVVTIAIVTTWVGVSLGF
ncbi:MAG: AzlD domain-containing protein [Alkalispirochaeta sp.]